MMPRSTAWMVGSVLLIISIVGCARQHLRFDPDDPATYANAWQPGWPIPRELLRYRNDSAGFHGGHCLPTDSHQVYGDVENYSFLWAVVAHPRTEERLFPAAVERALLTGGPQRFFRDLRGFAVRAPPRAREARFRALLQRAAEPHAWVDCAFIDDDDMPHEQARQVFDAMRERLGRGESWDAVYFDAQAAHRYQQGRMELTRVGNGGDFVVSHSKRDAGPLRWSELPESHVTQLLAARARDTLILHDAGQADSPPRPRLTLYFVRDVYLP